MVIGDDNYYCVVGSCDYFSWFTGAVSQNVGTTIKIGQLYTRARDASAGSGAIKLTNSTNEFKFINRILHYGPVSIFDADTGRQWPADQ